MQPRRSDAVARHESINTGDIGIYVLKGEHLRYIKSDNTAEDTNQAGDLI